MKDTCESIDPSRYLAYAGNNLEIWKEVVGQQVIHCKYVRGVISCVEKGPDDTPRILVQFKGDRSNRKFQPNAFGRANSSGDKFFGALTVPSEIVEKIVAYELHRKKQAAELALQKKTAEQKRERLEQQRKRIELIVRKARRALENEIRARIPAPHLGSLDIRLALEWSNSSELKAKINPSDVEDTVIQGEFGKDWELGRVLSARAAEKAAIQFYREYGFSVDDVSVTQVTQEGSNDWKYFDLRVNGTAIDVKNARSSKQNKDSYVEHCVPKLKSHHNRPIEIAGALSPYLWPSSILRPQSASSKRNTSITFLGTTTLQTISLLKQEFEIPGVFEIELGRLAGKSEQFIPAWMFDYPDSLYEQRNQALADIRGFPVLPRIVWRQYGRNPLPIYLAAGIRLSEQWAASSLSSWQWSFVEKVSDWRKRRGLALPFLFLSILAHFLQMTYTSSEAGYRPRDYLELLYFGQDRTRPLFIYDPLKTIYSLVANLETLWNAEHGLVRKFRLFQLKGVRILRGRANAADRQWKTLVAYCGGTIDGKGRCDKTPLVLGQGGTFHCAECGRLICPECQFCSRKCSLYKQRQLA